MTTDKLFYPAEWQLQTATLIAWPSMNSDWSSKLDQIVAMYLKLVTAITTYQQCWICCQSATMAQEITALLTQHGVAAAQYKIFILNYNDTWLRDSGPITTIRTTATGNTLIWNDFIFNGWGNKHEAAADNQLTAQLYPQVINLPGHNKLQHQAIAMVLEGGSIDSNGHGAVLTTTSCLLNPNRNPQLSIDKITNILQKTLASNLIHFIPAGFIQGDDTDGHIDMLARFCAPNVIAYVQCTNPADEHFTALERMAEFLHAMRNTTGNPYALVPLPLPSAIYATDDGRRLPASYANFILLNNAVILPVYNVAEDERAIATLTQLFPDRTIVPIDATIAIHQGGSLHCLTMHIPALERHNYV